MIGMPPLRTCDISICFDSLAQPSFKGSLTYFHDAKRRVARLLLEFQASRSQLVLLLIDGAQD